MRYVQAANSFLVPPLAGEITTALALSAVHAVMLALTVLVVSVSAVFYAAAAVSMWLLLGASKSASPAPPTAAASSRLRHADASSGRR